MRMRLMAVAVKMCARGASAVLPSGRGEQELRGDVSGVHQVFARQQVLGMEPVVDFVSTTTGSPTVASVVTT